MNDFKFRITKTRDVSCLEIRGYDSVIKRKKIDQVCMQSTPLLVYEMHCFRVISRECLCSKHLKTYQDTPEDE